MNWDDKKALLRSYLDRLSGGFKVSGDESPEALRKKQLLRLGMGSGIALLSAAWMIGLFDVTSSQSQEAPSEKTEKAVEQRVAELSTPLSTVKDGDIWVSRIEKLVKGSREDLEKIKSENVFLEKKINTLMGALGADPAARAKAIQELQALDASIKKDEAMGNPIFRHGQSQGIGVDPSVTSSASQLPIPPTPSSGPQRFPAVGAIADTASGNDLSISSYAQNPSPPSSVKGASQRGSHVSNSRARDKQNSPRKKLLHLSNANLSDNSNKPPETYLPAGTYFKVVTAMGVVVSTGTNSSSDPQPILLRIVDNGNLPGGLKGKVKDAVLIGTCYGSASAERAICRLKTLSWRDKSNRNIEKPVEGWIASEDGVQGIRAKIIDRSSEIAREAFGAGLLSAASNFFKMQSTSSVFPMMPFGQTNALSKGEALKGAIGGGVGSAMDKLADFSIKRAESMSPVAYVSSGRVLDAVLMRGVDLSPFVEENMTPVNTTPEPPHQPEPQGDHQ